MSVGTDRADPRGIKEDPGWCQHMYTSAVSALGHTGAGTLRSHARGQHLPICLLYTSPSPRD
eukprot:6901026-Alexandrium_andersonii.AAC.1